MNPTQHLFLQKIDSGNITISHFPLYGRKPEEDKGQISRVHFLKLKLRLDFGWTVPY
jgi:hypothetical protein